MSPEMYVAIIALSVALFEALATRRHNRLSLRPSLRIDRNIVLGKCPSITLSNTGAGPAIIKSVDVFVDSTPLPKLPDPRKEALKKVGISDTQWHTYELYPGETFAAGESHDLIIATNPIDNKTVARIEAGLFRISFRIKYTSVYNEDFELPLKLNPPRSGT